MWELVERLGFDERIRKKEYVQKYNSKIPLE